MQGSYLEKLNNGLLLASLEMQAKEPHNIVLDQLSKELRFLQRKWEYTTEIIRVLEELQLTILLLKKLPPNNEGLQEIRKNQEDLILFYQGAFFNLIHQLKDKVLNLVHLLTEKNVSDKPEEIKLQKLLKTKGEEINKIGIREILNIWDQESTSSIGVVLRKRRDYHHRVSTLHHNQDFQRIKFVESLKNPNLKKYISSSGEAYLENIRDQSFENLHKNTLQKMEQTLRDIEDNLEQLSEALIRYYKLDVSLERIKEVGEAYNKMIESFEIINSTSVDKIPEFLKEKIESVIEKIKTSLEKKIVSIYLVGSVGRGEYIENQSDINLYIITEEEINKGTSPVFPALGKEYNLLITDRDSFLSEQYKKYRFICRADGILLYGSNLIDKETFPTPGLNLAYLLNNDIVDTIEEIEKWIKDNPQASPREIGRISKLITERLIDFFYGVAMTNKPQYISSRIERIKRINKVFPQNIRTTVTLSKIALYGVGTLKDLKMLIETLKPQILDNL